MDFSTLQADHEARKGSVASGFNMFQGDKESAHFPK